ncbi:MAG: M48 family metallopeptidase [Alcanivoracaceae bacterium]
MTAIDYTVIRSRRRSLELRLYPDRRIEVRVPMRTSMADIDAFLASKARWLQRRLDGMTASLPPAPPPGYQQGDSHLFMGKRYPLLLVPARRALTTLQQGQLTLLTPEPDDSARVADQLGRWYRRQADAVFSNMIDRHFPFFAERGHLRPALRVRSMRSRWGSLSSRGYINLNLELIKTPAAAIEYVVVHELCHLEHMNHGAGFRDLLTRRLPDWQQRKRDLNLSPLI